MMCEIVVCLVDRITRDAYTEWMCCVCGIYLTAVVATNIVHFTHGLDRPPTHTKTSEDNEKGGDSFFFFCCCLARVRVIERCVYCVYAITSALSNVTSNSEWHTNAYILFCWRIYSMMRNFLVYILFFSFLACSDWISYETHRPTIQWSTKPIHFLPLTLFMQWNIYIFCPQSDMQSRQVTLRAEPLFELFIFKYVFGSYAWMLGDVYMCSESGCPCSKRLRVILTFSARCFFSWFFFFVFFLNQLSSCVPNVLLNVMCGFWENLFSQMLMMLRWEWL